MYSPFHILRSLSDLRVMLDSKNLFSMLNECKYVYILCVYIWMHVVVVVVWVCPDPRDSSLLRLVLPVGCVVTSSLLDHKLPPTGCSLNIMFFT